jgi:hypothetical protein
MTANAATSRTESGMKPHGYIGVVVIFAAETLLILGNEVVGRWFTPIVWTGYVLFIDAINHKVRGRSLLVDDRREFLIVCVISVATWWLFELYNAPRFWRSDLELWWHYHNLEPNLFLRRIGYDWAFATISAAMFETAELLGATLFKTTPIRPVITFSRREKIALIAIGAFCALIPLILVSEWLVPLVWLAYILLFDPLNALAGRPAVITDFGRGEWRRPLALLAAGGICGVLWEFWNYWALSKWTYTVPYLGNVKIFEMPVLGYLGFPPFAIECWAIYVFVRGSLLGLGGWGSESICPTRAPDSNPTSRR